MRHFIRETLFRCRYSHCSRCMRVLPLTSFRKDRSRPYGIFVRCKACQDAYKSGVWPKVAPILRPMPDKAQGVTELQWLLERSGLAYCKKGDHILPRASFYRDASEHGLHSHCRDCHAGYGPNPRVRQPTATAAELSPMDLSKFRVSWR